MAVEVVAVVETIPKRLAFGSEAEAEEEEREEGIECGDQEADDVIPEAEGTFVATVEFAKSENEWKNEIFMMAQSLVDAQTEIVAKASDGQRYQLPPSQCGGEKGSSPEGADDLCLVCF